MKPVASGVKSVSCAVCDGTGWQAVWRPIWAHACPLCCKSPGVSDRRAA